MTLKRVKGDILTESSGHSLKRLINRSERNKILDSGTTLYQGFYRVELIPRETLIFRYIRESMKVNFILT